MAPPVLLAGRAISVLRVQDGRVLVRHPLPRQLSYRQLLQPLSLVSIFELLTGFAFRVEMLQVQLQHLLVVSCLQYMPLDHRLRRRGLRVFRLVQDQMLGRLFHRLLEEQVLGRPVVLYDVLDYQLLSLVRLEVDVGELMVQILASFSAGSLGHSYLRLEVGDLQLLLQGLFGLPTQSELTVTSLRHQGLLRLRPYISPFECGFGRGPPEGLLHVLNAHLGCHGLLIGTVEGWDCVQYRYVLHLVVALLLVLVRLVNVKLFDIEDLGFGIVLFDLALGGSDV